MRVWCVLDTVALVRVVLLVTLLCALGVLAGSLLSAVAGSMNRALIVDGRNYLDPAALTAAGFEYEGIGRQVQAATRIS